MNENFKKNLSDFIDAVVQKNDEAAKTAFSSYSQEKAKEMHAPKETVLESTMRQLSEAIDFGHGFTFDGPTILLNGKRIGTVEEVGEDEFGKGNTLQYVDNDGETFTLPNNETPPLVEFLYNKYIGKSK